MEAAFQMKIEKLTKEMNDDQARLKADSSTEAGMDTSMSKIGMSESFMDENASCFIDESQYSYYSESMDQSQAKMQKETDLSVSEINIGADLEKEEESKSRDQSPPKVEKKRFNVAKSTNNLKSENLPGFSKSKNMTPNKPSERKNIDHDLDSATIIESGSKNDSKVLETEDDTTLDHQGIYKAQSITDMSLDVQDIVTNLQDQMESNERELTPRQDFRTTMPSDKAESTSGLTTIPTAKAKQIKLNTKLVAAASQGTS